MKAMSRTIPLPLPLLPSSSSPHLLLRRLPLLLRRISLPTTTTPPQISPIVLSFSTLPPLSSSFSTHSLSSSLNDAVLEHQATNSLETLNDVIYEDKVENTKTNSLAVNDVVLDEETDNSDYEDKVDNTELNLLAVNDVVLEEETDNSDNEDMDEDKVVDFESEDESDDSNAKALDTLNDVVLEEEIDEDEDEDEVSKGRVLGVSAKAGPSLSVKEKKELASYAHTLGKDLRSQQVGKSGVTDTVITALIETLEKRELLKVLLRL